MVNPFEKLKGRNLMLCNIIYQGPTKKTDWHDYIVVVYRDMVLDKKETYIIEDPEIDIFEVKSEYRKFIKARHFISKNKLNMHTVKYKNVQKEVAKIGGENYLEYYRTHTKKENRNMFKYPYVVGADVAIETFYHCLWTDVFGKEFKEKPTKLYFDIEVDQYYFKGNMAKEGEVPVNAFSIVDDHNGVVHEFLLNEPSNPLIKTFRENIAEFYQKLHDEFDDSHGVLEYKIYLVDDEREMLVQIFNLIRVISADFTEGWNIFGFDIKYLIYRAKVLNIDPANLFCDPEFPNKHYYFYDDTNSFDFANKRSYFSVASKTHYSDMIINYPSLRKSGGAVKRVNLGYIAKKEINDDKLDYSDAGSIRTLPYEDYERFVRYSIKDSLLLRGIDRKAKDTDNIYLIAHANHVPYKDCLKQTVVFRSLMYGFLRERGIVLGHNVNFDVDTNGKYDEDGNKIVYDDDDEDEDDTFEGAINGDTKLNNANGIILYNNVPSMFLYKLIIDFDFSAMYPNSICAFNIFATTMIGKVIIEFVPEITYDVDMGKEYIEDVICGDVLHIGHKWHNLSSFETLNEKMKDKLTRKVA